VAQLADVYPRHVDKHGQRPKYRTKKKGTPEMGIYLGLLHELCSINSAVEQLHKKLEFVE